MLHIVSIILCLKKNFFDQNENFSSTSLLKIALIYFCNYIGQNAQIGVVNLMVLVPVVSEFAVIVSNQTVIILSVVTASNKKFANLLLKMVNGVSVRGV